MAGPVELGGKAEAKYRKQDYSPGPRIEGLAVVDLKRSHDDGGSLTELARISDGRVQGLEGFPVAQVNYSTIEPGVIKAFHLHWRQTDVWYVPPEDRILLVLVDVRKGSPTEGSRMRLVLGGGSSRLVRIPPGVAHGCRNLGSATGRILYFTDLPFSPDPEKTDEGRLPWDFLGPEIWEVSRE